MKPDIAMSGESKHDPEISPLNLYIAERRAALKVENNNITEFEIATRASNEWITKLTDDEKKVFYERSKELQKERPTEASKYCFGKYQKKPGKKQKAWSGSQSQVVSDSPRVPSTEPVTASGWGTGEPSISQQYFAGWGQKPDNQKAKTSSFLSSQSGKIDDANPIKQILATWQGSPQIHAPSETAAATPAREIPPEPEKSPESNAHETEIPESVESYNMPSLSAADEALYTEFYNIFAPDLESVISMEKDKLQYVMMEMFMQSPKWMKDALALPPVVFPVPDAIVLTRQKTYEYTYEEEEEYEYMYEYED